MNCYGNSNTHFFNHSFYAHDLSTAGCGATGLHAVRMVILTYSDTFAS